METYIDLLCTLHSNEKRTVKQIPWQELSNILQGKMRKNPKDAAYLCQVSILNQADFIHVEVGATSILLLLLTIIR